jgi:translation initiation factor 2B subunit (eIF-2B alpha/beta/delta family)
MSAASIIEAIRNETRRGASDLVRDAVLAYDALVDEATPATLPVRLGQVSRAILEAQPAMAPLFALACAVLRSAAAHPDASGRAVRSALQEFATRLDRIHREVPERAEGLVPAGGRVLTLSASSTVRRALCLAAGRRTFDVCCLEGRPGLEGRDMARGLAEKGIRVAIAVDAACGAVVRDCDVVLVGADSIGDLGVVNKIGTRAAALLARRAGVPIYALADSTKLLPTGYPQELDDARPGEEVWSEAPATVDVWNRYFEATPLSYLEGVVTEDGLRTELDVELQRSRLQVPPPLRRAAA